LLEQDIGDRQPNRARDDQTRKRLLARSRLVKHEEHPEQPVHLHFFAQLLLFVAHHALHCPDGAGLVVVVSVTVLGAIAVVVEETSPPWQEQQGSTASAVPQFVHSKTLPCRKQSSIRTSKSRQDGSGSSSGSGVEMSADAFRLEAMWHSSQPMRNTAMAHGVSFSGMHTSPEAARPINGCAICNGLMGRVATYLNNEGPTACIQEFQHAWD